MSFSFKEDLIKLSYLSIHFSLREAGFLGRDRKIPDLQDVKDVTKQFLDLIEISLLNFFPGRYIGQRGQAYSVTENKALPPEFDTTAKFQQAINLERDPTKLVDLLTIYSNHQISRGVLSILAQEWIPPAYQIRFRKEGEEVLPLVEPPEKPTEEQRLKLTNLDFTSMPPPEKIEKLLGELEGFFFAQSSASKGVPLSFRVSVTPENIQLLHKGFSFLKLLSQIHMHCLKVHAEIFPDLLLSFDRTLNDLIPIKQRELVLEWKAQIRSSSNLAEEK